MTSGNQSHLTPSSALITGVLLMLASVPLVLLAVLLGSGGEMIAFESRADHLRLAALISFPALMFAIGAALLWGSRTGRYRLSVALALLTPVDAAAMVGTFSLLDRSKPAVIIPPSNPNALIWNMTSNGAQVAGPAVVRQTASALPPGCPRNSHDCDLPTIVALDTSTTPRPEPLLKPSPATSAARP